MLPALLGQCQQEVCVTSDCTYQIELASNAQFFERSRHSWPYFPKVFFCREGGVSAMHRVGLTRAKLLIEPQLLTPISGIQNCKRTLLEDACRVVFLGELWDCPVINALVVPWFVFFMLQLVKTCSKSWRWRGHSSHSAVKMEMLTLRFCLGGRVSVAC